ncbi:MAG: PVC-type heme-binding CxxCH protein, partial [Chthoniobacteraceae bacterium]
MIRRLLAVPAVFLMAAGVCNSEQGSGVRTLDSALQSFELADGLNIELVASEPLTASPCAMAFDEHGRLFVAENRGYPRTTEPPQGSIALLEDIDRDGRMDKRTVFADGLTFPNGVLPWRGGLFVTCAPDLLYLRDTDGDGRADERKVVLTGFATSGSTQLRVNAPILGPDGWIWLASGLIGGKISNPAQAEFGTVEMKGDLRFDPHSGRFEAVDGRSQYGHSFDALGRRFICMNRIQVQHVVLPSSHLRRNPYLAFSETVQNCPDLVPNPLLRGGGGAARIFPISANITTADSHAGTFSAACAVTIWDGSGALPPQYANVAFSCDPTGNLIHADKLEPKGATFAAKSMFADREFLASRDDWFRPVFLTTGPDGALYVCDMYRKVIEHPDYLPGETAKQMDFEAGKESGRIWRIRSRDAVNNAVSRFPEDVNALGALLSDANPWTRATARRLLLETREPGKTIALSSATPEQAHDPHWLQTRHLLSPLSDEELLAAAKHPPGAAVALTIMGADLATGKRDSSLLEQLGEQALTADSPALLPFVTALASVPNSAVAAPLLVQAARASDPADRWMAAAIVASSSGREMDVLSGLLGQSIQPAEGSTPHLPLLVLLSETLGRANAKANADSME